MQYTLNLSEDDTNCAPFFSIRNQILFSNKKSKKQYLNDSSKNLLFYKKKIIKFFEGQSFNTTPKFLSITYFHQQQLRQNYFEKLKDANRFKTF